MTKFLSVYLISNLLILSCFTQLPPFDENCETTAWPAKPDRLVPTYVVNLDLPPQQRWVEIATAYKSQINGLLAYFKTFLLEFSDKFQELINLIDKDLGNIVPTLPDPYGDEITGIANAVGFPLGDAVLYNIFYEAFTLCTSIVSQDQNGRITHARNLDFGLFIGWDVQNKTWIISELLRPLTINVNFTRGGQLQYKSTTFAGFVGVLTGIRPNVFSFSMNDRFQVNGGYIGLVEWFTGIDRNQSWVTLLPRDLLEKSVSFDDAVEYLADTPIMAPCYYIVGGPNAYQGAVITRDRAKAVDVWKLGTNNTWFIAETNYDHWNKPLFLDDRITPTNTCMNKMGQDSSSFAGIFNVLSTKPVRNKLTVYTALMDVQTGHTETYIQYCEDPCWFI